MWWVGCLPTKCSTFERVPAPTETVSKGYLERKNLTPVVRTNPHPLLWERAGSPPSLIDGSASPIHLRSLISNLLELYLHY